mmetsp:Transcript_18181/g.27499  ORF Transcript_18181/g.27499 Transcript_18181/m.27499 type:complete len:112 (-) Transcript_18181:300-635(-)|eukprot:CAMPEP_0178895482 /NCGR_PEP_ID=MMETSP0786-20121207/614_1 /TAXON_ID=186022 /ORGANISM="Thalassionema frauenfeldii, Strain CCMP 1798" /LENGTH=111 /DNA_ID=CAMNT_0020565723 /DNA_START=139 /DNA_END=474 /DNA_ORIENTATION=-
MASSQDIPHAVKGTKIPPLMVADKCHASYKSITKKKKEILFDTTGDRKTNMLLEFLRCQVKTNAKTCKDVEKEYTLCHRSFMGVGSYKGMKHCGERMAELYQCVISSSKSP